MSDPRENAVDKAKRLGLLLVEPKPDELFVDIDSRRAMDEFLNRLSRFISVYKGTTVQYTTSVGGNWHAYVTVPGWSFTMDQRIAMQAVHTLFPYQREPEFGYVLKHLHERFRTAPQKAKEQTLRLLTLFRDGSAVPTLIEVFERKDKKLYDAVEGALTEITKQRFGTHHKRWLAWWQAHKDQPRVQWLLAGLDTEDADLRESALAELRLLAGTDFGFDCHAPRRKREAARRRAEQWANSGVAQPSAPRV